MTAYEVIKHESGKLREVHQHHSYFECSEFVHEALKQPENADCLYTINEGEKIMGSYRNVEGRIICKPRHTEAA